MSLFHLPTMTPVTDDNGRLTPPFVQLFTNVINLLNRGYPPPSNLAGGATQPKSVTVPLGKLTTGGTAGSLTFTNGLLTSVVDPT